MRKSRGRIARPGVRRAGGTVAARPRPISKRTETVLRQLREVLESAAVRVRHERLLREVGYHPRSGLCRVGGQLVLLIDHELDVAAQLELLVDALESVGMTAEDVPQPARSLLERREPQPDPAPETAQGSAQDPVQDSPRRVVAGELG